MLNKEETGLLIEHLVEVIEERKIGYQKASDKMSDPYLRELFKAHSSHSEILKKEILKFSDSTKALIHNEGNSFKWKNWFEMKSALKSSTRADLLSACISGEQRAIDLYQELISDPHLSAGLKTILKKQFQDIKTACDLLKVFKICL